jgi:hypothetical protein
MRMDVRIRGRAAFLLAALALSGAALAGPVPGDAPPADAPATPAAAPADGDVSPAVRHARSLQEKVVRYRGLAFKSDIPIQTRDAKSLRERLLEDLAEEYPPARMRAVSLAGIRLGLFPEGFDLGKTLTDVLTEQIAGFYDPKRKELCLIDRAAGGAGGGLEQLAEGLLERMTGLEAKDLYAIHELTHAVQDQHFDLETLPIELTDNDDVVMAAKAVVEGDATFVMFDAMARAMGQSVDAMTSQGMGSASMPFGGRTAQAPEYLRASLVFPYLAGLTFVTRVRRAGGWPRIDALYGDLPASTEQILHPEKFLVGERDVPQVLRWGALDALPAADWTVLESNVLGEFGVRQLLKARGVRVAANRYAAGWDGDRYVVYERTGDGALLLLWASTWDNGTESAEFVQALAEALDNRAGEGGRLGGIPPEWRGWRWASGDRLWMIHDGVDVFLVEGWPGDAAPVALVEAWRNGIRREELKRVDRVPKKPRKAGGAPEAKDPAGPHPE